MSEENATYDDVLSDELLEEMVDGVDETNTPKKKQPVKSDLKEDSEKEEEIVDTLDEYEEIDPNTGSEEFIVNEEAEKKRSLNNDINELLGDGVESSRELEETLQDPSRNDRLLQAIEDEEPTITIFNEIMREIAVELAYLKSTRRKDFLAKEDFAETAFKRVKSLRELVETLVKREQQKEKKTAQIDFYGEGFEKVVKFFLNVVSEAFNKSNIPQQFHDIFFAQLGKDLEGFEKKVEKIYNKG